jgi:hypothetical protein
MFTEFLARIDAAAEVADDDFDCDWDSPGSPLSSDPDAELAREFYLAAKAGKPLVVELAPWSQADEDRWQAEMDAADAAREAHRDAATVPAADATTDDDADCLIPF